MIMSTAVHVWLDIGYKQTQKHTLATYRSLRSNRKKPEVGGELVFYAEKRNRKTRGEEKSKKKKASVDYNYV